MKSNEIELIEINQITNNGSFTDTDSMNRYEVVDCCICLDTLSTYINEDNIRLKIGEYTLSNNRFIIGEDISDHSKDDLDFIKMNCCNQKVHKICLLEWINYPRNYNYSNKLSCVICKTKIKNLESIIPIGEFINYIENKRDDYKYKNNDEMVLYYKKIISELYTDSIITIIFNSNDENDYSIELRYCFYNFYCIIFFFVVIIILIFIGTLLVKK